LTCKDCLYYGACDFTKKCDKAQNPTCYCFKDRSKFIEIPCKPNDIVYLLIFDRVVEVRVYEVVYNVGRGSYLIFIHDNLIYQSSDVGKYIFFTREEAEKELEARQNGKK